LAACAHVAPLRWQWPLKMILQLQQPFRTRPVFAVITALRAPLLQTVGYAAKLHS